MLSPSGKVFQLSYSPITAGAFVTLGKANVSKYTVLSVALYISKYLLLELPSIYSLKKRPSSVIGCLPKISAPWDLNVDSVPLYDAKSIVVTLV